MNQQTASKLSRRFPSSPTHTINIPKSSEPRTSPPTFHSHVDTNHYVIAFESPPHSEPKKNILGFKLFFKLFFINQMTSLEKEQKQKRKTIPSHTTKNKKPTKANHSHQPINRQTA
jgi:hypothetical protein